MIEAILSAMLALVPPGQSAHSVVPMSECGRAPLSVYAPEVCGEPGVSWSPLRGAFVRWEIAAEGRARYETIASALDVVALEATTAPEGERPRWPWARRELVAGLLAIARHESAFRRDVHEGATLGGGKDVCLVQIRTGGIDKRRESWLGRDLVGLDVSSTVRCFRAGAELLTRARWACARHSQGEWFGPAVALYGSGRSCSTRPAWVQRRAATYRRALALL